MPGATSHLSEVLFWPDAIPLLGSQTRAVATEGGEGNSQALALLQALAVWEGLTATAPPGLGLLYLASFEEPMEWDLQPAPRELTVFLLLSLGSRMGPEE